MNRNIKNLIGERFGMLTVQAYAGSRPNTPSRPERGARAYWRCKCECGAVTDPLDSRTLKARFACCGSPGCRVASMRAAGHELPKQLSLHEVPTGKVFGRLTVTGPSTATNGSKRHWTFRCDCGVEKSIRAAKVSSGEIASCGCLNAEAVSKANRKFKDPLQMLRNSILGGYKRHARERGFPFELDPGRFFELIHLPCRYCGRADVNFHRGFSHNGVDRVDSSLGYVEGNCVPCCGTCNIMKQRLSVDGFVSHLKMILKHTEGASHGR